ncbi:hypothetical protein V6N11_040027 [Hibiscus sabdariffa]|uniref:Uncharacterized protein n=1 Tax=Hibiscus sabdariffa TaxID=183260 RepID=A0ABR2RG95_9ROSI
MEETKVFQTSFINFLCFQFPNVVAFFTAQPTTTQPMPPADPSAQAGNTEEVHFFANAENDIFDWHTPMEHHAQPEAADIPESSITQKRKKPAPAEGEATPVTTATTITTTRRIGKTPAGRIIISDRSSSPEKPEQPPAKRQMRYHVITTDSDDDSSAGLPVAHPEQSADPSLSYTF